ncbi:glycerol kinase [Novosphingobium flavum]|uniref:ATP:glycerol 3-phosphotransferase n=1 Tax=Novosphingobium flavum TaxID=1778672 RepID=A0A7X1KK60_9SPHN|nr:FGGY family carbohydrate kinase [Novosphingobium flavum]MBC2664196.1 glycerol kinase [Novosphingobium flavum]
MSEPLILAIDQGTTNTKALLVAPDGSVRLARSQPMGIAYPQPGWVEQSALEIRDVVQSLVVDLASAAEGAQIAALAISNQRETVVVWDATTGEPLGPAIVWQCRRSADRCDALDAAGHGPEIARRSGLGLDPLFPAGKIAWLLDSVPGSRLRAERGEVKCGTVDSWLLWNLTGGAVHATDHSNASRTQLFSIETLGWDEELARLFNVPLAMLPEIMPSDSRFGEVAIPDLASGIPVRAMIGDSHAALFAQGAGMDGATKVTIGTGSSLMTATPSPVRSSHGLSTTIAWNRGGRVQYALEGNISVSGHAAAFATGLLGLPNEQALSELAASVPDNGGVVFVPALAGLGAPHWCSEARGSLTGLSLGTTPAHVARATLEAIALQICDVIDALDADLGTRLAEISVDGGASRNDFLVQLLADLAGRDVARPAMAEASALGAARLAREAMGTATAVEHVMPDVRFAPAMPEARRQTVLRQWSNAVASAVRAASTSKET